MCDTPAIRVEEWNGVQLDGAVFDVKSQTNVLRMKVNISVREHYTLGIGARAAGIEKLGQRVFVDGSDVGAMRGGRLEKIFVVAWRKPWRFWSALKLAECSYFRNILAKRLDQAEKLFLNKEDCRPGIIQNVAQFARCEPDVEREQHGAGFWHSVVGFEQAVAVAAEERDAIAGLNTSLAQSSRKTAGAVSELRVSK